MLGDQQSLNKPSNPNWLVSHTALHDIPSWAQFENGHKGSMEYVRPSRSFVVRKDPWFSDS